MMAANSLRTSAQPCNLVNTARQTLVNSGHSLHILAIDTSSKTTSVALLQREAVLLELDSDSTQFVSTEQIQGLRAGSADIMGKGFTSQFSKRRTVASRVFAPGASALLAPMIKTVLGECGHSIREIDLIAVSSGPGLFTGLRVGVVTAKSLAYATNAQLVGINTLEVIAAQTLADQTLADLQFSDSSGIESVRVILNAQRKQLFCGHYRPNSSWSVTELETNLILDHEEWLQKISPANLVTGSGLKPLEEIIRAKHPGVKIAPLTTWDSTAASVGKLAWQHFQNGKTDDLWKLQPFYFRPSAAEEKRDAQKSD